VRAMHVNGRELAVESVGYGPPVLFLHGIGGTSNVFQIQADVLSARYQVIRLDFAGAGRSPVADGISVESHTEDARAVLAALGVARAVVAGHSMGTLVARMLAARHPDQVAGLALLSAVRPPNTAAQAAIRDRAAILRTEGGVAIASTILAASLSQSTRAGKPEVAAFVRELIMRQHPEGYARNNEALAEAAEPGPVAPDLPLLLVAGSDDQLSPPSVSHEIAAGHPSASVEVIDGIRHWSPLEDAMRTTELLDVFVATCLSTLPG
jgi:3-oxoadipate enol-lactonase